MFYNKIQSCSFSLDLSMRVFMYHKSVACCKAVKVWANWSKYTFILGACTAWHSGPMQCHPWILPFLRGLTELELWKQCCLLPKPQTIVQGTDTSQRWSAMAWASSYQSSLGLLLVEYRDYNKYHQKKLLGILCIKHICKANGVIGG